MGHPWLELICAQPLDATSPIKADLVLWCAYECVPTWGHLDDPMKTTLCPFFRSLCTEELNAIRRQKCSCRSFLRECVSLSYVGCIQHLEEIKDIKDQVDFRAVFVVGTNWSKLIGP